MKELLCWIIGHKWELILGSKNHGWAVYCNRCGKSITGNY